MRLAAALVMLLWLGIAYSGSLDGPFFFDDITSITENRSIRQLWHGDVMRPPPATTVSGRPLINISLALNYAVGGLAVRGYHLVNLALHMACALLVFGLLRRTLRSPRLQSRWAGGATVSAFVVALLWSLHPLQSEAVTYVVQRTEIVVSLFYLLTLYAVARSRQSDRVMGLMWQGVAVVSCACGMASKEIMVSCPLMVVLYEWLVGQQSWLEQWRQRRLLYLLLATTWGILAALVLANPRGGSAGFGLELSPLTYLRSQCEVVVHYLRLSLWPAPLVVDYHGWNMPSSWQAVLPQAALLLMLGGATLVAVLRRHWAALAGVWFFMILAPTSSVVPIPTELAAERRMYLPSLAVVASVVLGLRGLALWARAQLGLRVPPFAARGLLVAVLLACTLVTYRRTRDYRSAVAIWTDTVAKRPNNGRAHDNLATALAEAGSLKLALKHFDTAIALDAGDALAYRNRGYALLQAGQLAAAERDFRRAVELAPEDAPAHYQLGTLLMQKGQVDAALASYRRAIALDPDYVAARTNLGNLLVKVGRAAEGLVQLDDAMRLDPGNSRLHFNRATALHRIGQLDAAIAAYRRSIGLDPEYAPAHNNLGIALAQRGDMAAAERQFRRAVQLDASYRDAQLNLARILQASGRVEQAQRHRRRAEQLGQHARP